MFILSVVISAYASATATAYVVNVTNQTEFDSLGERLISLLDTGVKRINVVFAQGIYFFHEDHLNLKDIEVPDAEISFEGNGSVLMAEGGAYCNGDIFTDDITPTESIVTTEGLDLNMWSKMLRTSNYLMEVVDEANLICRLNASDLGNLTDRNEEECRWMYIWIPQWYYSGAYKVKKIESGYIYFTSSVNDLNYDHSYGKITQLRFRLCNNPDERGDVLITGGHIYLPNDVKEVRHTKVSRFLNSYNSSFNSLSFNGLKFYGNGKPNNNVESPDMSKQLLDFRYTKCEKIKIEKCEFRALQTTAINMTSTNNAFIEDCQFEDCYSYCVHQDRSSRVCDVHACTFHNVNKRITFSNTICCSGSDFHIYDNTISDFGYVGIAVGIRHGHADKKCNCNGVVERNELFYTQPYFEAVEDHNLMDSGAIYLYTISNSTTIRYNYIHHYGGVCDNRGIFCDDGAMNFQIYGNTITNLTNSYSIDSRRVASLDSKLGAVNVNNVIRDNIVDRPIRFQGNEKKNNGCIFEGNIHLDGNYADDKISNVNQ